MAYLIIVFYEDMSVLIIKFVQIDNDASRVLTLPLLARASDSE